jgi:cell division transport system permease protein
VSAARVGAGRAAGGTRLRQLASGWLWEQARVLVSTFGEIARRPLGTALTAAVIGVALALPAGLYSVLKALERAAGGWAIDAQVTLYLRPALDAEAAGRLANALSARSDVVETRFIDRDAALVEFRQWSGFAAGVDALADNPLPHVIVVYPERSIVDTGIEALQRELSQLPAVESAQLDRQWLRRLSAIGAIARRAILVLACLLGAAVTLVVGNTIRLGIAQRAEEIEISQLFGATDRFIRRPFAYQGALLGAAGGFLAWLIVYAASLALQGPVDRLAGLYGAHFALGELDARAGMLLALGGAALGLLGSWATVNAHLRALRRHRES